MINGVAAVNEHMATIQHVVFACCFQGRISCDIEMKGSPIHQLLTKQCTVRDEIDEMLKTGIIQI